MTDTQLPSAKSESDWLIDVVADCLRHPGSNIERQVSLVRYGLDSLGAIELTTAIAAKLNCDVPDSLLLDHPSLEALESYIQSMRQESSIPPSPTSNAGSQLEQILADAVLPADICPDQNFQATRPANSILLTGATGYLGAYLLRALLRDTPADIFCLVRSADGNELARVHDNLKLYGVWEDEFAARVHAVEGDLQQPALGVSESAYQVLVRDIDEIYHCGAAVNWVLPYDGLRDVNVLGTRELLRLACRGNPKPFHFISTMAVCYSTSRLGEVSEQDDQLPHLDGIHLGYAQSKCVAEALVRCASDRGLPATIHRPTLITGDATTGFSNPDDLLSTMIRGCIQMGSAPDLGWVLDCCSVDYAADAIVGLSRQSCDSLQVFHLSNPSRRRWREVVLWMNLFGYRIRLDSYRDWLAQMRTTASTPDHPLYRLRSFFLARPGTQSDLTLPELYEEHRRNPVSHTITRQKLAKLPLVCPPLDARLLDRYFASFIEREFLPDVATREQGPGCGRDGLNIDFFQSVLRSHFEDDTIKVKSLMKVEEETHESITTELTSWQFGNDAGLWKYRLDIEDPTKTAPKSLELFVKVKPQDQEVLVVSEKVAAMCDDEVGQAFARHKHRLGIVGGHTREVNIYREQDSRFRLHTPVVYAAIENEPRREWILILESLAELELLDSASDIRGWRPAHVEAAIKGIAQIHSIWYEREPELEEKPWLEKKISSREMAEMTDLWESLADYSWKHFSKWIGADTQPLVAGLIADVGGWWQTLEQMPQTLIHNDFNPRNIAFRNQGGALRLCAYDWELAAPGIPQHDLAELLCFVLQEDDSKERVLSYIELHRIELSNATGCSINPTVWRSGVQLALRDLILNRFPMYCLIHTFRPQPFLPRIIRTWRRLHDMLETCT